MIISFLILTLTAVVSPAKNTCDIEQALLDLDRTLALYDNISSQKESRIDSLKKQCLNHADITELYHAYDAVFDEYLKWDSDSAYAYANLKMDLAEKSGEARLVNDAIMDISKRYIISGMHHEALSAMHGIDIVTAEQHGQSEELYSMFFDLYNWLSAGTSDMRIKKHYESNEVLYLKRWAQSTIPESTNYNISHAASYLDDGNDARALDILEKGLSEGVLSAHDYAMIYYYMAKVYQARKDEDKATYFFIQSAKYDLLQPVKEYSSLIRISQYCYKQGDIKRAYEYIMRCDSDAIRCDAKHRINQIAGILPEIIYAYEKQNRYRSKQLTGAIIFLSLAFILLVAALSQLRRSYLRILETNQVKDAYLGEFLAMFADHINSLEKYRSNLRTVAKQKDFNAIQQELRSDRFIDQEWDYLMKKFDNTFLGLFPHFISDLNALLQPDKRIGQNLKEGELSNELRVFALIRLGITEPTRISKYLRLSASTVYNYRNKLRNAAIGRRGDFDSRLMRIGN